MHAPNGLNFLVTSNLHSAIPFSKPSASPLMSCDCVKLKGREWACSPDHLQCLWGSTPSWWPLRDCCWSASCVGHPLNKGGKKSCNDTKTMKDDPNNTWQNDQLVVYPTLHPPPEGLQGHGLIGKNIEHCFLLFVSSLADVCTYLYLTECTRHAESLWCQFLAQALPPPPNLYMCSLFRSQKCPSSGFSANALTEQSAMVILVSLSIYNSDLFTSFYR